MTRRHLASICVALAIVAVAPACGGEEAQPEPGVGAFCERIAPLANLASDLASEDVDLGGLADDVEAAAAVAPPAVAPSIQTIAEALTTMTEAAAASGEDGQAALAAAFSAIEGDRAALERASAVVEGYAARECGVDLTPGDTENPASEERPTDDATP